MASLADLHAALDALRHEGKSSKVFFYYLNADGVMRSGNVVVSQGSRCLISFEGSEDARSAMAAIPALRFSKISQLPSAGAEALGSPNSVDIDVLLAAVHPANAPVPEPEPEPVPIAKPVEVLAPSVTAERPAVSQEFYSHVSMQRDATEILEGVYGIGAGKKVEEIALTTSPVNHPAEFLDRCRQQAAMMLGAKKAEALFAPLFAKLR